MSSLKSTPPLQHTDKPNQVPFFLSLPNSTMLSYLFLLSAVSVRIAFALPTVEINAQSSPLRITHISIDGPTCDSFNTSPPLTQSNAGMGATGQIGFDTEVANAKPEGSNLPYSDCTMTVDFNFPIGFHLNWVQALAKGWVDFGDGMNQALRMDIWFPSNNAFTVSNSYRTTYPLQGR
jgi:hypothetical protein